MKNRDLWNLFYQLASPIALMVLGVVLIFSPDTASAMIARILGWLVMLVGVGFVLAAVFGRSALTGKILGAVLCLSAGCFLLANPLLLAAWIGRILGILIALRGIRDVFRSRRYGHGQLLALITAGVGIILVVLPMTTSRLVFSLCGVVVLVIGIAMLLDRLKDRHRYLDDGGDPNIIDAL